MTNLCLFSVFVASALNNLLGSYRLTLPCLTLPFNIVTLVIFACLMPPLPHNGAPGALTPMNDTLLEQDVVMASKVSQNLRTTRQAEEISVEPVIQLDLGEAKDEKENSTVKISDKNSAEWDVNTLNWGQVCIQNE